MGNYSRLWNACQEQFSNHLEGYRGNCAKYLQPRVHNLKHSYFFS